MFNHLRSSVLLIMLVLIALLTFWVTNAVVPIITSQGNDMHQKPDYIIENLSGIRANHESTVQRNFSAKKLLHYLDGDVTYMEKPYFANIEIQKPIMRVKADKARLSGEGENVYLTGNVKVLRGEDSEKITMMTSYLHLIPGENIAKTNKTVVFSRKNTTINAVGLELDNHTGIVQLLSRVRASDY